MAYSVYDINIIFEQNSLMARDTPLPQIAKTSIDVDKISIQHFRIDRYSVDIDPMDFAIWDWG